MDSTMRLIALFSLLAATATASAQDPSAQDPPALHDGRIQFEVKVETVNLDVVVTDRRGRFVPGLKAESFEVLENGTPQEIQFFTAQFTPVTTLLSTARLVLERSLELERDSDGGVGKTAL